MKASLSPEVRDMAIAIMAKEISAHGLRLEDNFRIADEGLALTHAAAKVVARSGIEIEGNDSIASMGIDRTDGFLHPLSEALDGEHMNLWAMASMLVSAANGWLGKPDKALPMVVASVARVAPNVSTPDLLQAARYDDRALLKLTGLVFDGLDTSFAQAFGKQP